MVGREIKVKTADIFNADAAPAAMKWMVWSLNKFGQVPFSDSEVFFPPQERKVLQQLDK